MMPMKDLQTIIDRRQTAGFDAWQRPVSFDELGTFIDTCEVSELIGAR
ncbi:hypothetical protein IV500_04730 [Paeniglutamicibacter antarcticus]|uniref:Uncharacterized protein n=1 Tax=Arthrobacter terrae TaxID=2935737 RepID=A0A931CI25_9MICC|nr:hypothetical protein [Arthrobacter terrae]MBG0738723.1 hypothetical protein [Arthrobacter terrae]